MPAPSEDDAVVIGAGPNGLAAAITLARAGLSVQVLEGSHSIGGGVRSEALTLSGFTHDVCSAVHPLAVGTPFFEGIALEEWGLEWIRPPIAVAHPLEEGRAATLSGSVETTAATLGADGEAYRDLMGPLVRDWAQIAPQILGPPRVPSHPVALARFGLRALRSARSTVERRFRTPEARALFAGLAAHSILPLEKTATAAMALVLATAGHAHGWPLPRGGSQRIADALAGALTSMGGRIELDRPIHSLEQLPPARAYLFDVTPAQLLRIAGDALPRRYRRQLARFRHGPGIFKVDWALADAIPWTAPACRSAGTVHLGGGFEAIAAAESAVWAGRHPTRPFVLLTQPSLFDPSRAPAGRHVAWAYCHVPHAATRDVTSEIEASIERMAPGFRDLILARHTLDAAQLERRNPNYIGGDISGGAQNLRQILFRPVPALTPYATPDPRIFLCSSSTPPGGGVHGMCGHHAARAVLRRLEGRWTSSASVAEPSGTGAG